MLQWLSKIRFLKTATILGLFLVAVFFVFHTASAESVVDPNAPILQGVQIIEQPLGLPSFDIRLIIARIIRVALGFVGIILVVLMMYAGFLWMTAGGNDEQITQAKSIIRNAVIGLAIILSAYSIVSFVMKMLGVQDGGGATTAVYAPGTQNFSGSGALGKVIKDHYPARDQKDVSRNTKIVITFTKPVLLSSFVDDSNGTGVFGDCKNMDKATFSWFNDCDHVVSTTGKLSDNFINVSQADTGVSIKALVVVATTSVVNNITGVYTIVLKPITDILDVKGGYLGNIDGFIPYNVHLGSGILADDSTNGNPSVFQSQNVGNNYYAWKFTCSNVFDISPPVVTGQFPDKKSTEAKNSVIQISFSEPMDPTGLQGIFNTTPGYNYYSLSGNQVYSNAPNSSIPLGTFSLINNYQTLEFTPSKECGKNACGNPIYCLPVCDKPGAACKGDKFPYDDYQLLVEAAKTLAGSFESKPFTGAADMSGNALDGNKDGKSQTATTTLPVFNNWDEPDNFSWAFKIEDKIDASSPYLKTITPGIKAQNVPKDAKLSLLFSKQMRAESAYSISITEFPAPTNGVPLWTVPFVHFDYQTFDIKHGPFLDNKKQLYIPIVSSTVEDVHFNCFYPGEGPKDAVPSGSLDSKVCDISDPILKLNCCGTVDNVGSEFCCNGVTTTAKNGINNCIDKTKLLY